MLLKIRKLPKTWGGVSRIGNKDDSADFMAKDSELGAGRNRGAGLRNWNPEGHVESCGKIFQPRTAKGNSKPIRAAARPAAGL